IGVEIEQTFAAADVRANIKDRTIAADACVDIHCRAAMAALANLRINIDQRTAAIAVTIAAVARKCRRRERGAAKDRRCDQHGFEKHLFLRMYARERALGGATGVPVMVYRLFERFAKKRG